VPLRPLVVTNIYNDPVLSVHLNYKIEMKLKGFKTYEIIFYTQSRSIPLSLFLNEKNISHKNLKKKQTKSVVFVLIFVHLAQINGCPNYPMCELPTAFFGKIFRPLRK
jgi:hypothetical protein